MYIVRAMTPNDISKVASLERECFVSPWTEMQLTESYAKNYARFLVAELNNEVVGYVGAYIVGDDADITNVAVTSHDRGRGIGEALMKGIEGVLSASSVVYIRLECRVSNVPARALYEKLGYKNIGIRPNFYVDHEDAVMYEKRLSQEV